jgi:hypothetical protein
MAESRSMMLRLSASDAQARAIPLRLTVGPSGTGWRSLLVYRLASSGGQLAHHPATTYRHSASYAASSTCR